MQAISLISLEVPYLQPPPRPRFDFFSGIANFEDAKCPPKIYIMLSSYVEGHVKKKIKSEFHGWFPGLQYLGIFWKIY